MKLKVNFHLKILKLICGEITMNSFKLFLRENVGIPKNCFNIFNIRYRARAIAFILLGAWSVGREPLSTFLPTHDAG